mmetsp:Transcript_7106/g.10405  ORF Transcript_7106/g.10405 Transcript_7106/m.10405 type:complete len:331 (-) Transcript_7106:204-1196(-)|eukprot:CAMPEP_0197237438 /NCGR_PEP_ID=MMETSP1429-20130617/4259_1 /TAXON_ID=49237 /ORGANISM="Chaetoceros  sp., Strain UNC1202" /LENGTH=330 /DNA_ID=CAMNT_0042696433 /DNA_START=109 /DNA_END=1101 /DNA_ORIENTATION=-
MKVASAIGSLFLVALAEAFSPSQLNQRRLNVNADRRICNSFELAQSPQLNRISVVLFAGKVGIFFGSSTGATEGIADMIAAEFAGDAEGPFEIDDIQGSVAKKFGEYDALVVGTPTWNTGADSERSGTGWDEVYYGEMQDLNIAGKQVAVFGLGDQISYSENYADASGELHDVFEDLGCKMMGYTSQDGYEHDSSKAIRGDQFCGLLCDEVNQDDLSEERVQNWVTQLRAEGILDGAGAGTTNASAPAPASVAATSPNVSDQSDVVAELERENARLRKMLEDSKVMDEVLKTEMMDEAFTPHYNTKTCVTMWTSTDGKTCYYTKEAPKSP